ncbi:nitrite reductase small subunit NirD [Microbacterium sp. ET2]|uniref:nitrite reductase small subunit NirD n=1 Tax=Microbacterium albipurpureum TaxID=3050384 RepID=UPI00259CAFF6|nr:nitrite reductase small subunit NirD [Microbacterium sp. ET2 (Ac-2212)]WJL96400.1 nitrite reductase small subunit NirD [Microbacterium sp. ET2 (Ac-2212)]
MSLAAVRRDAVGIPSAAPEGWVRVCALSDLAVERGSACLLDDTQIALFRLHTGRVHAVANHDPYSGAQVISRGIVGTRDGIPTVASPMYKQVFDLRTGVCLDTQGREAAGLQVFPASVLGGDVWIRWGDER